MNVRFYLSYDIKITLQSHFLSKNMIILSLCMQRCYGRHNFSLKICKPLHDIISLPDTMSCDNYYFINMLCVVCLGNSVISSNIY